MASKQVRIDSRAIELANRIAIKRSAREQRIVQPHQVIADAVTIGLDALNKQAPVAEDDSTPRLSP